MTGRGFRDESCSRGLSTVTVENVRFFFFASSFKKKQKTNPPPLPAFSRVRIQPQTNSNSHLALIQDVMSLTTHSSSSPSIFYYCLHER